MCVGRDGGGVSAWGCSVTMQLLDGKKIRILSVLVGKYCIPLIRQHRLY